MMKNYVEEKGFLLWQENIGEGNKLKSIYTSEKLKSFVLKEEIETKVEWLDVIHHSEKAISKLGTLMTAEGKEVEAVITKALEAGYNFIIWEEDEKLDIEKAKELIVEGIKFQRLETEEY